MKEMEPMILCKEIRKIKNQISCGKDRSPKSKKNGKSEGIKRTKIKTKTKNYKQEKPVNSPETREISCLFTVQF